MALSEYVLQTLYMLYIFTALAILIMAFRLVVRRVRGQKWNLSDYLTMVCMFCLLARTAMVHVVLIWGTNNVPRGYRHGHVFSEKEIYQRETGSKLILTSRTFYNTYLWLQKAIVLLLYRRILFGLPWTDMVMNIYWGILAGTYVVIQVATFTDCRPLHLYWQVVPFPGNCSEALGQLIILGALNIVTDVLLIILPMPALLEIRRSLPAKLRLFSLFSLGIFLVVITVIRLPLNFANGTAQVNRTTWASVEAFTAAFVANVPTLYTLRRKTLTKQPHTGSEGLHVTIGSGNARTNRRISDASFMSDETLVKEPEAKVSHHVELFEKRQEDEWNGSSSRVKDNNAT